MFEKILIANRGEIAVRIIKTCRRLGVKTALVHSVIDACSLAHEMADETVCIGPPPATESYLVIDKIVDAVRQTGAQAVHPGYGFLSENSGFAQRLESENIAFVGPNPGAIESMGDKITAKTLAAKAGVSTVPGVPGLIDSAAQALEAARTIGYPVMIKASAGGGGKGIRIARNDRDIAEGYPAVQAEARASFGDERIFMEKFIAEPRHVEIQVMGDKHGHCIHLFERECSIQRRNQKVFEEAPSPLLDGKTRMHMGNQAVALARAVGYDSAGTVEFVASGLDRSFYFLEMNTRLQVEHPVTEMITGIDLVEQMLRVACGEKLTIRQEDVKINGWAVESRIYAEDPCRGFLPSTGRLKHFQPPQEGPLLDGTVRVDSGVRPGDGISMYYDPMVAKLVTHAPDRNRALMVQSAALDRFHVDGIGHNIAFCSAVMNDSDFQSGTFTTAFVDKRFPDGFTNPAPTSGQVFVFVAMAILAHVREARRTEQITGRIAPSAPLRADWVVIIGDDHIPVRLDCKGPETVVVVNDQSCHVSSNWRPGMPVLEGLVDGQPVAVNMRRCTGGYLMRHCGVQVQAFVCTPAMARIRKRLPKVEKSDLAKHVVSPMPGLVVSVHVAVGETVRADDAVCIVEAMKMQNIVRAAINGTVKAVRVAPGDNVAVDEVMVELE